MVHVASTEISIPCFLVLLFAGENEGVKPHDLSTVHPFGFMNRLAQLGVVFTCVF